MAKPSIVRIDTRELAPTQCTIGAFEVRLKADRFRLMSPRDVDGYIEEKRDDGKPVSLVKGLHRYFVVDGHHTLCAIVGSSEPRELYLDLVADFSGEDASGFWKQMRKAGFVLEQSLGAPVKPEDFPERLPDLVDDPFRSVAWLIRKMGAFEDLKKPYQEFAVADFLRERLSFRPVHDHEYELVSLRAFELMRSSEAKAYAEHEPRLGFVDEEPPDNLTKLYYEVLAKARAPRYYGR